MKRSTHILLVGFLCGLTVWLSEGFAAAQFPYNPYQRYVQRQVNRQNWNTAGMIAQQNGQVFGTNYGIPTYAAAVANYYTPNYYSPYYAPGYTAPISPGYANPYSPAAPGYGGVNPYSPVDPNVANPYSPYSPYNPYGAYGAGSALSGQADVMRAFGQQANSIEQSRIVRERWKQEQIKTKKDLFDFQMYVKANTPTYTQEQERIGRITLQRILKNSTSGEVSSGKALNYILKDLRTFRDMKVSLDSTMLPEDILSHLNVTSGTYGMGILRDGGKVSFPVALQDAKDRPALETQLVALVKAANKGDRTANVVADVRSMIRKMREDLADRVNEVPNEQYLNAKDFLEELRRATFAVESGQASNQAKFKKFVEEAKGGRSIQELADFMVNNGLNFGPATTDDEAAYRAVHSAIASYDIAMNSQHGEASKE